MRSNIAIFILTAILTVLPAQQTQGQDGQDGLVVSESTGCTLADAIKAANTDAVAGNCKAGHDGLDYISLGYDIVVTEPLPAVTTVIQIWGREQTFTSTTDIAALVVTDGGKLTLHRLTVQDSTTSTASGIVAASGAELIIDRVKFLRNTSGDVGGAIYAQNSNVTLRASEFTDNSARASHGGAVYFTTTGSDDDEDEITLTVERTVFTDNTAAEDGGAMKVAGGNVDIKRSTFAGNSADEGGAVEISNAVLNVENSTFSRNTAREGGGLSVLGTEATITHATFAYNAAQEQGASLALVGDDSTLALRNTLMTDAQPYAGYDEAVEECHLGSNEEALVEDTGNFIQDGSCVVDADSDETGDEAQAAPVQAEAQQEDDKGKGDAMIAPLAGVLPVHELKWGSPAIDGGDSDLCADADQVDTGRPQYLNCDIGAWEYPAEAPTATPTLRSQPQKRDPTPTRPPRRKTIPTPTPAPTSTNTPEAPASCIHVVRAGDNMYRIGLRHGFTPSEIGAANNLLNNWQLAIGQRLLLPYAECRQYAVLKG